MKRIVLCADDFGQAEGISNAILTLIAAGRLSATSCLVTFPLFQTQALRLQPFHTKVAIGLHVNLTEGEPLSQAFKTQYGSRFLSLGKMLSRSMLGFLDEQALVAEIRAQLMLFREVLGFYPDFIDGHQHVHQFPVVRTALLRVLATAYPGTPYVRWVNTRLRTIKSWIIYLAGTRTFGRLLDEAQIAHNTSFAGIYAFHRHGDYPALMRQFLREVGDGGLVMTHPGGAASESSQTLACAREAEFQYLASDDFLKDCQEAGVTLKHCREFI